MIYQATYGLWSSIDVLEFNADGYAATQSRPVGFFGCRTIIGDEHCRYPDRSEDSENPHVSNNIENSGV